MNTWRYVDSSRRVVVTQDGVVPCESHSVESHEIRTYIQNGGIIDPEPIAPTIPINPFGITLYATAEPPTPLEGEAFLFLDAADGYVKVKYSDGRVAGFLNVVGKAPTGSVEGFKSVPGTPGTENKTGGL